MSPKSSFSVSAAIVAALATGTTDVMAQTYTVEVVGPSCVPVMADTSTAVGEVCSEMVGGNLEITVKVDAELECSLQETHLCNMPVVTEFLDDVVSYTYTVTEEEATQWVCAVPEDTYVLAGHASIVCGSAPTRRNLLADALRRLQTLDEVKSYYEVELACVEAPTSTTPRPTRPAPTTTTEAATTTVVPTTPGMVNTRATTTTTTTSTNTDPTPGQNNPRETTTTTEAVTTEAATNTDPTPGQNNPRETTTTTEAVTTEAVTTKTNPTPNQNNPTNDCVDVYVGCAKCGQELECFIDAEEASAEYVAVKGELTSWTRGNTICQQPVKNTPKAFPITEQVDCPLGGAYKCGAPDNAKRQDISNYAQYSFSVCNGSVDSVGPDNCDTKCNAEDCNVQADSCTLSGKFCDMCEAPATPTDTKTTTVGPSAPEEVVTKATTTTTTTEAVTTEAVRTEAARTKPVTTEAVTTKTNPTLNQNNPTDDCEDVIVGCAKCGQELECFIDADKGSGAYDAVKSELTSWKRGNTICEQPVKKTPKAFHITEQEDCPLGGAYKCGAPDNAKRQDISNYAQYSFSVCDGNVSVGPDNCSTKCNAEDCKVQTDSCTLSMAFCDMCT